MNSLSASLASARKKSSAVFFFAPMLIVVALSVISLYVGSTIGI